MRPSLAIAIVQNLMEENAPNLLEQGWQVEITERPQRRLGLCVYRTKRILLSEKFVLLNNIDRIQNCGLHEIAHAIVGPGHGHGPVWKLQAIALGIAPERCDRISVLAPGKYVAVCPNPQCQRIYQFYRKPKIDRLRWCRKCGRVKGTLKIVPYDQAGISTPQVDYPGDLDALIDEI
jgi:hypothetical protein